MAFSDPSAALRLSLLSRELLKRCPHRARHISKLQGDQPVPPTYEYTEARPMPRLDDIYFSMPLRLGMELDVPVADYALRSDFAHRSGHGDAKLIVDPRLAVVFHRYAEGATVAAGAGEQDGLR
jgi:hypothetical protein